MARFLMFHLLLLTQLHGRIIQHREPKVKVDPMFLNNVLSQIVESSMDDMRYRLKQAIFSIAIKKGEARLLQDDGTKAPVSLGDYEEWLLDQFVNQLTRKNDSSPIEREDAETANDAPNGAKEWLDGAKKKKTGDFTPIGEVHHDHVEESPSHKMTIALETYTVEPLKKSGKLVTAEDLRMMDSVEAGYELRSLPWWLVLLAAASVGLLILLLTLTMLLAFRQRRRRHTKTLNSMPHPLSISSLSCVPDCTNTQERFVGRMINSVRDADRTGRDREAEIVWARTATTSLESVARA